jgi:lipopolysaccharide transport system ATP-binding protein
MKPIIEVRNLSKKYKIGERQRYLSLRDSVSNIFSKKNTEGSEFWALDDVSFDIHAGESIGIIGRNGAGKSTLLKILSRITPPTKGSVILRGRMASLLEVGTGFHSELTGRENVFMNGSILGLKKREIEAKFDEIVDFSGVEQFIDTPLKHFSSGMQLRLAFAVAAHLEPEILVIDEVLAVGDAEFQKRCLGKMDEVSRSGRTVLFVSHNLGSVQELCDKCIYLDEGKIKFKGSSESTIAKYLENNSLVSYAEVENKVNSGDSIAKLISVCLKNKEGRLIANLSISETVELEIIFQVLQNGFKPIPSINLLTIRGESVFASIDSSFQDLFKIDIGVYKSIIKIPAHFFNNTTYSTEIHLTTVNPVIKHALLKDLIVFEVNDELNVITRQGYTGFFPGVLRPKLEWIHEDIS